MRITHRPHFTSETPSDTDLETGAPPAIDAVFDDEPELEASVLERFGEEEVWH